MTIPEYIRELTKLGFEETNFTTNLSRRWDHFSGESRWIAEPKNLTPAQRRIQINSVRRSIGVAVED